MKSLYNKISKTIAETVYYNQEFLKKDGNSDQFFKAISYPVNLDDLYVVRDTCYYHEAFDFCPVIVEIIDQRLKDHFGGNFLMQVWNKQGVKVYEKVLQYHFAYRLHPNEAGAEHLYVHNMRKKAAYFKIKNFVQDDLSYKYLGVCNACFYIGNSNTIKIIDIHYVLEDGKETALNPTDDQILTYKIGDQCKLHGFFENKFAKEQNYLICLIETEDNQIDFARLYFWSRKIEKGDISFIQYTEVVHRDVKLDPIVKYRQIVHNSQFQFGVALRDSGKVDLYWNCTRVNSPDDNSFVDVDINFQNIYLVKRDGTKLFIDTKWDSRLGLETAEEYHCTANEWENIFYRTIANCFKFYPSFCLINTSFFLAHGNIISIFDIIKKEWTKHFMVEEKVIKVFRNEKDDHLYNLGAYLDNGRIKLIDTEDTNNPDSWEMTLNKYGTKGQLISISSDMEHYRMIYILTNEEGTINLYGFTRQTLYIFNTLVHDIRGNYFFADEFLAETIIVPFFSPADRTEFILYNKEPGDIRVYTHYWAKNAEGVLTFYLTLKKHYQIAKPAEIKGTVHAAMSTDTENYLFLVDEKNFYKLNVKTKEVTTYPDQNVVGLQFLDNTFCYTMTNKSPKKEEYGFYIYDIQQLIDNDQDNNFLLDKALVGVNGLIDFSFDNQRLSYQVDYKTIQIVPSLHRNVINFMCMQDRKHYIATKKIKDKFIALDDRNVLTTWNAVTGKLEFVHQLKDIDLQNYRIYDYEDQDITYKSDWYQPRSLLISREPLENITDDQYFEPEMLRTSLENNKPHVRNMQKKFHNFKMIEIINEREVKEHFTFIHPFYGKGKYQRIYLSDNMEYMLERLVNQRVFLYQKQKGMFGMVKWKIVRRLTQWPMDMSEATYANYLCSPDLMYYLDYDRQNNVFVIKETLTQNQVQVIPTGLMNPQEGNVVEYAKRFKWVDSNTIKLVNKEGVEKIVDIKNGFQEIAFGTVPLFYERKDYKHYYFITQSSPEIGETLKRLKHKYRIYKTNYYLEKKREPFQLYDKLFSVDFGVNSFKYKYVIDLSFTYLHWRLAEQVMKDPHFSLDNIDPTQARLLVYNIFPQCNTILHYSARKQNNIKEIFSISERKGEEFEIPFLNNLQGESPIHKCLLNQEFKTVDYYLQKLANQPLDHHSRAIVSALPLAIDQGLESVGNYIDARFLQTEQIKKIRRGCLNVTGSKTYASIESQVWMDTKQIEKALFRESPIESDLKLEFLDLPKLHCYGNKTTNAFFDALANTENIELFANRGIQTIIDYKWGLTKEYTIKKLFVPFICYMMFYFYYANFIFVERYHESPQEYDTLSTNDYAFFVVGPIVLLLSLYFVISEIRQMINTGTEYLTSLWNYLDFVPPILITMIIIQDFLRIKYEVQHSIHAISCLLMWFKLLYFLRIFKKTGYLIRMIIEVIKDMQVFFIVLVIVLCAFADAYLSLSQGNPNEELHFAGQNFLGAALYSYMSSLGDFQTDAFDDSVQPFVCWLMFLLSTVLVLIVMLNLLIAIISESFAKINDVSTQANYQERARIISENSYLIPDDRQLNFSDKNKYLLVAQEVEQEEEDDDNVVVEKLTEVSSQIKNLNENLENLFKVKFDELLAEIKKKKE